MTIFLIKYFDLISNIYLFNIQQHIIFLKIVKLTHKNTNILLTECKGLAGEHWPEHSEVYTKTNKKQGQYSPVQSQASEVSKLFISHYFLCKTTLLVVHPCQLPVRCQGKSNIQAI